MGLLNFIGFLGMVLLVVAWIPQTLRTIRTKMVGVHPKFLWIYFFGSLFLTLYAISIFDIIFIILNGIATAFSAINIYYMYESKEMKRKKERKKI
jgi:lipid-A-disaccharide synthase-like uncharacterized protein